MYLEALATALEARSDLRALLEIAERIKLNLFHSDLEGDVFKRSYEMVSNIVRDAEIAIENIDLEFDKLHGVGMLSHEQ